MNSVQQLAKAIADAVKKAKNGGVAVETVYFGGFVTVNGRQYPAEVIVPILVRDGQRVFVQISAGDDKAYIIG